MFIFRSLLLCGPQCYSPPTYDDSVGKESCPARIQGGNSIDLGQFWANFWVWFSGHLRPMDLGMDLQL